MPVPPSRCRLLLCCVGNPLRGDDGVAAALARRLRRGAPTGALLRCTGDDPAGLLEDWARADALLCVDAAAPTGHPGRILRLDACAPRPRLLPSAVPPPGSSHGLGLGELLRVARALGRLPPRVVVYTVEAAELGLGQGLSPAVRAALPELERRVREELPRLRQAGGSGRRRRPRSMLQTGVERP